MDAGSPSKFFDGFLQARAQLPWGNVQPRAVVRDRDEGADAAMNQHC